MSELLKQLDSLGQQSSQYGAKRGKLQLVTEVPRESKRQIPRITVMLVATLVVIVSGVVLLFGRGFWSAAPADPSGAQGQKRVGEMEQNQQAWEHYQNQRYDLAAAQWELLRQRSSQSNVVVNLAMAYKGLHEYQKSLVLLNQLLEREPRHGVALNNRALLYQQQNELDRAISDLKQAVQIDYKNATFHFNLATLYEQSSLFDQAVYHYNRFLHFSANDRTIETAVKEKIRERIKRLTVLHYAKDWNVSSQKDSGP